MKKKSYVLGVMIILCVLLIPISVSAGIVTGEEVFNTEYEDFEDDVVYYEGADGPDYNDILDRIENVEDFEDETLSTNSVEIVHKKYISRYKVNGGVGTVAGTYDVSVTSGSQYVYGSNIDIRGKLYVDGGVVIKLKKKDSDGNIISNETIKPVTSGAMYVDFQKMLMTVTSSATHSIEIIFSGSGNVNVYGPYRIYSNTTIKSNYSANATEGSYVKFNKISLVALVFINTDDESSRNYLSSQTTYTGNDAYRAAKNITYSNMYVEFPNGGNINFIKMIHASNITVKNCKFYASNSEKFNNHVIEFTGLKDSTVNNCGFIAQSYDAISDAEVDSLYYRTEVVQIEEARWGSNPYCKFPAYFYVDTNTNTSEFNKSYNITVSNCSFEKVPNCVGDHRGSAKNQYSSLINITNCDFISSQIAIHLRSLINVNITNCYLNSGRITGYSKRVRCSNKLSDAHYSATFTEDVVFN